MLTVLGGCLVGGALKGWTSSLTKRPDLQIAFSVIRYRLIGK